MRIAEEKLEKVRELHLTIKYGGDHLRGGVDFAEMQEIARLVDHFGFGERVDTDYESDYICRMSQREFHLASPELILFELTNLDGVKEVQLTVRS